MATSSSSFINGVGRNAATHPLWWLPISSEAWICKQNILLWRPQTYYDSTSTFNPSWFLYLTYPQGWDTAIRPWTQDIKDYSFASMVESVTLTPIVDQTIPNQLLQHLRRGISEDRFLCCKRIKMEEVVDIASEFQHDFSHSRIRVFSREAAR